VAIVPAYNEAKTIRRVVERLCASLVFDEVIVVSDGSTDETARIAHHAGARVIELERNLGKGLAMQRGVGATKAPIIAFFDADVIGLRDYHIPKLVNPVLQGDVGMNVGLNDRGRFITRVMEYLPLISGQRALRRELFEQIPQEFLQGYMVESSLNYLTRAQGARIGTIPMRGVHLRTKVQKVGWRKGFGQYVRMIGQVVVGMFSVRMARAFGAIPFN
jgi:glycosyltransferase involved in cell wall biosynthesis